MKSRAFFKTGVLLLLSSLAGLFSALPAAAAPSVAWGTYMGGESTEDAYGVAVDSQGNVYVVGSTTTSAAPWVGGGWDAAYGGGADGWLVKLTPAGAHVWSTYLGGDDADYAMDLTVDGADNLYIFGFSSSAGWVADGFDTSFNGQSDAFVVRLTSAGAHVWSTYLGGSGAEMGLGGALDPSGNVLITGDTTSAGLAAGNDTIFEGGSEGFVVKLTPACAHMWSTYVGGAGADRCRDIAVDGAG
ncbi:MAG TPA: SBBP repeat-containing protein, partial [Candidatus Hydrogenedentes bacterium]|nr:SBBP repeat-containing protein [Candidatus Hydrogenedentota bacterium]